jgi:hypothetical protein
MGTRADYYVGRGKDAEWIGSSGWDGYPGCKDLEPVVTATSEETFRAAVEQRIGADDGTHAADGWPWPWDDSRTTDYAYAFDGGQVWISCFGSGWMMFAEATRADDDDSPPKAKTAVFPNMKERKNVQFGGKRSGLIVVGGPKNEKW